MAGGDGVGGGGGGPATAEAGPAFRRGRGAGGRCRRTAPEARKLRRRVVLKSGDVNVCLAHISQWHRRFLQDLFTTLVDAQWRWTLLIFALSFILSWLGFALLWWQMALTHGNLDLPAGAEHDRVCVQNLLDFTSAFLFSIETQHTIGYGPRYPTAECPHAAFLACLQSLTGVMIQTLVVGVMFAKLSRAKHRAETLLFSRHAVVCERNGRLCLMFRIGDMRSSRIIGARVRAQLIRTRTTVAGETLVRAQSELEVGADDGSAHLFFIWPTTIVHHLTASSPLYGTAPGDLRSRRPPGDRFEIVAILEGTIESTGRTAQVRSSYIPSEILWGRQFAPCVSYSKRRRSYEVNYAKFNATVKVPTPHCSAHMFDEFFRVSRAVRSLSHVSQKCLDPFPQLPVSSSFSVNSRGGELDHLDNIPCSTAEESDVSDVPLNVQQNSATASV